MLGSDMPTRRSLLLPLLVLACGSSATADATNPPPSQSAAAQAAPESATTTPAAVPEGTGLVHLQSADEHAVVLQRALDAIAERGLRVMAQIDHAANAQGIAPLRANVLIVFGNPQAGTKLMTASPQVGIDLPMKLLIWEDDRGGVHLAYNDPRYLAARHGITGRDALLVKIDKALSGIASAARGS